MNTALALIMANDLAAYHLRGTHCPVVINPRLRRSLGRTTYSHELGYKIELSQTLLDNYDENHVLHTILHEIAHVLASKRYRHHGHGLLFQCIARDELGIDPSRYHPENVQY